MIFLACEHHEVTNFSVFMVHNFSAAVGGKGHEIYANAMHTKGWSEDMLKKMYKDFLTDKEIAEVLKGEDLYLTGESVNERIDKRNKKFTALKKKFQREQKIQNITETGVAIVKKTRIKKVDKPA